MHFKRFVLENDFTNNFEIIRQQIVDAITSQGLEKEHCLFRGYTKKLDLLGEFQIRTDRTPKDTSQVLSAKMDSLFNKKFGVKLRSSSLFCTYSISLANSFNQLGDTAIIIPKPGSVFYVSAIVKDMTRLLYFPRSVEMITTLGYTYKDDVVKDLADSFNKTVPSFLGDNSFGQLYTYLKSKPSSKFNEDPSTKLLTTMVDTYTRSDSMPVYSTYKNNEIMITSDSYYYVRVPSSSDIKTYKELLKILKGMKKQ
jgi:hypothetical protein